MKVLLVVMMAHELWKGAEAFRGWGRGIVRRRREMMLIRPESMSELDWKRIRRSADKIWRVNLYETPGPQQSPDFVVKTVLKAIRKMDTPSKNHGCQVAIDFCSSKNPTSSLTPELFRNYLLDDAMPYRILREWDEIDTDDLTLTRNNTEASQQVYLREKEGTWQLVIIDLRLENDCWLIDRIWIDTPKETTTDIESQNSEKLYSGLEEENTYKATEISSYPLRENPEPQLQPFDTVANILCALRVKDSPQKNHGCQVAINFASPANIVSTMSPEHFRRYLDEAWYEIINTWEEMSCGSVSLENDDQAYVQVLLKPPTDDDEDSDDDDDDEWMTVNWDLSRVDGKWMTEKMWVNIE